MTDGLHLDALASAKTALDGRAAEGVRIAKRTHPPEGAAPVALIASFTRSDQLIVPLWSGINRVGFRPPMSDYEKLPNGRWFESRQWLITIHDDVALVTDDRSTNQSGVLAADAPRIESVPDRRFESSDMLPGEMFHQPGMTMLDWHGTVAARLTEGSTLFSSYAGFVFGRLAVAKSS